MFLLFTLYAILRCLPVRLPAIILFTRLISLRFNNSINSKALEVFKRLQWTVMFFYILFISCSLFALDLAGTGMFVCSTSFFHCPMETHFKWSKSTLYIEISRFLTGVCFERWSSCCCVCCAQPACNPSRRIWLRGANRWRLMGCLPGSISPFAQHKTPPNSIYHHLDTLCSSNSLNCGVFVHARICEDDEREEHNPHTAQGKHYKHYITHINHIPHLIFLSILLLLLLFPNKTGREREREGEYENNNIYMEIYTINVSIYECLC